MQDEILAINTDARNLSLQVALLVPAIAGLLGFANSFRMLRLPDITPAAPLEGLDLALHDTIGATSEHADHDWDRARAARGGPTRPERPGVGLGLGMATVLALASCASGGRSTQSTSSTAG